MESAACGCGFNSYLATRHAGPDQHSGVHRWALVTSLVTLLAIWPHVMGAGPLDVFHGGIERVALILGLG